MPKTAACNCAKKSVENLWNPHLSFGYLQLTYAGLLVTIPLTDLRASSSESLPSKPGRRTCTGRLPIFLPDEERAKGPANFQTDPIALGCFTRLAPPALLLNSPVLDYFKI